MPKFRKCKKQRVLSGSMTLTEVEEWFEAKLLMERRQAAKKRKSQSIPTLPRREHPHA